MLFDPITFYAIAFAVLTIGYTIGVLVARNSN